MVTSYSRATARPSQEPWIIPLDSLVFLYQAIMVGLILGGDLEGELKRRLLTIHGFYAATLLVFLWNAKDWENPLARFLREFYPLLTILLFYRESGFLVHAYFAGSLDEHLLSMDRKLGGIGTALWNLQQFYPPGRWLTEIFSLGYAFYFLLIPGAAWVMYLQAPLPRFRGWMFTLAFTYYLHYIFFILLPADSPRFFVPGLREPLEGFLVSGWLTGAVEGNAFPGGSFPSSHIAAAVVSLMVFPYLGKWGYPVVFMVLLMGLGTLYGRYHYFIDVLAGLAVGLVCCFLGPWLERNWPLVFDEKGIVRGRQREALDRG